MKIVYWVDNVLVDVLEGPAKHINNGWFEPHYRKELGEVKYEFEIEVSFDDFFDFVAPWDIYKWAEEGRNAYKKACEDVWNSEWFDLEALENDKDFIDYMKDKYQEDAEEQCRKEYEEE